MSHWLRQLQCVQVWLPNMLEYLHSFFHCFQTPLTAAAEVPITNMFHVSDMFPCIHWLLFHLMIVLKARLPEVVILTLENNHTSKTVIERIIIFFNIRAQYLISCVLISLS